VTGVDFLEEMGVPEAMWHLQAKAFPCIVTMDANGNSLHKQVDEESFAMLESIGKEQA
jgi:fumarate hydratase, class I